MMPSEARAVARSAYLFLYPLVVNYGAMYEEAIDPTSPFFAGGFGRWTIRQVMTGRGTTVGDVEAARLCTTTWVDVASGPWTLTMHAAEATRGRVVETVDLWDFLVGEIGSDDDHGCRLLLDSPASKGDVPVDVDRVVRGESPYLRIEMSTELDEPHDLDRVPGPQQAIALARSSRGTGEQPTTAAAIAWLPYRAHMLTGFEFWSVANFALSLVTLHDEDRMLLERVAPIGVMPGRRWLGASFTSEVLEAVDLGMDDALNDLMRAAADGGRHARQSRHKMNRDYVSRALAVLATAAPACREHRLAGAHQFGPLDPSVFDGL